MTVLPVWRFNKTSAAQEYALRSKQLQCEPRFARFLAIMTVFQGDFTLVGKIEGREEASPVSVGQGPARKSTTLTVSLYFQSILNRVNVNAPVGNLTSPLFGESTGLAGNFGGFGGGGGGSPNAGNRRIYASMRLSF